MHNITSARYPSDSLIFDKLPAYLEVLYNEIALIRAEHEAVRKLRRTSEARLQV